VLQGFAAFAPLTTFELQLYIQNVLGLLFDEGLSVEGLSDEGPHLMVMASA
jgi:hypothetical protein